MRGRSLTCFVFGLCVGMSTMSLLSLVVDSDAPSALEMSAIQLLETERAKNVAVKRHFEKEDRYIDEMRRRAQAMDGLWQEGEVPVLHMPEEASR